MLENGAGQFFTFVCMNMEWRIARIALNINVDLAMYAFITPISQYLLMGISEYIRTRNRHLKILSVKPYRRIAV